MHLSLEAREFLLLIELSESQGMPYIMPVKDLFGPFRLLALLVVYVTWPEGYSSEVFAHHSLLLVTLKYIIWQATVLGDHRWLINCNSLDEGTLEPNFDKFSIQRKKTQFLTCVAASSN